MAVVIACQSSGSTSVPVFHLLLRQEYLRAGLIQLDIRLHLLLEELFQIFNIVRFGNSRQNENICNRIEFNKFVSVNVTKW